ncbi:MAG: hypothetical protein M3144_00850, partial [Actinomycetota bacterium]|nr:hypothetical protein [Actinomycetota bacterium]
AQYPIDPLLIGSGLHRKPDDGRVRLQPDLTSAEQRLSRLVQSGARRQGAVSEGLDVARGREPAVAHEDGLLLAAARPDEIQKRAKQCVRAEPLVERVEGRRF